MKVIEVQDLTKDYGNNRGIYKLTFSVKKGETVAFLGSNGAGKTTTIRHLMGFIKPQTGQSKINGINCFNKENEIQKNIGYLPGEVRFLDENMTGCEFIDFMSKLKRVENVNRINDLMNYFELDGKIKIKRMSKGTKQKVGLVVAFMSDSPILILDEPTSGLDPIMQNRFVELIIQEKRKGKTIFMSSHIFEEVENTCDRILCIKSGKLIADENIETIKTSRGKDYIITFADEVSAVKFQNDFCENAIRNGNVVSVTLVGSVNPLIHQLNKYNIIDVSMRNQTVEEVFMKYYGGDKL